MILQMHWQYPDGHTECKSQKEFPEYMHEWVRGWIADVTKRFPIQQAKVQWLMVLEASEYFEKAFQGGSE